MFSEAKILIYHIYNLMSQFIEKMYAFFENLIDTINGESILQ